ncbi:MAG: TRAP-type C4-dicarboxylate transport system permease small subunit [Motiliproteus sp.]|jgi:TRAP-type C4-dicarboxylate transport system permease small subunit
MINKFFWLDNKYSLFMDTIIIISSIMITVLMLFLVLTRYVFGWSVVGLHEIALILAMWLYMTGALTASRRSEHLVVDFLAQKITSPKVRLIHQRTIALIMIVTCIFFVYLSWRMLGWSLKMPQTTAALSLPLLISQSAIIFASIGCLVYAIRDFLIPGHSSHNINNEEDLG